MAFTGAVSSLIPGMMSLSVLGKSTQMIPQYRSQQDWLWTNGKKKSKDKSTIKGFTEIMIGVPLISETSGMVAGL